MPTIKTITYGRVFNNGNYETSRIDITADITGDAEEAFEKILDQMEILRNKELDYVPTLNETLPRRPRR